MPRHHVLLLVLGVLIIWTTAACSGNGGKQATPATGATTSTTSTTGPTASPPAIQWTTLRNPLLRDPTHAVKDAAIVFADGRWRALFSSVDAQGTWRIGVASSADLRRWSKISTMPHNPSVEGEASPDVVRAPDGKFVVT